MLKLNNLSPTTGSRKDNKRVGRGPGSGRGKTATRGHKGARARTGYSSKIGFEGGQMPLQRRLPKRGFTNAFKKEYAVVSLSDLNQFANGTTVDKNVLIESGLVNKNDALVKVLANGDIRVEIIVDVDKVSEAARDKIIAAGGSIKSR